jgi:aspartyl aminopeptidase
VDRDVNTSFKFNQETEFVPIVGLIDSQLNAETKNLGNSSASSIQDNHHPALLSVLANELSVAPEEIHDFELYVHFLSTESRHKSVAVRHLYDTQPSVLGGINNEFIFSPRLDNMFSS